MPDAPHPPAEHYTVWILRYGHHDTVRREVFLNHHLYRQPDGPVGLDYFFWVARNPWRTVVVDTGFSAAAARTRGHRMLVHPARALHAIGVDPDTVDTVVLTHAHYDHVGNVELFPHATVVMAEREYSFWTSPLAARRQFAAYADPADLAHLAALLRAGRLELFTDTTSPAPGIVVHDIGGHTPGTSIVTVATPDGPVLLASDAIHLYEELTHDMPFTVVADLPATYRGYDRITDLLAGGQVRHLITGHDPTTLARFTASSRLPGLAATIGHTDISETRHIPAK